MTEYDYSPEAWEEYVRQQEKISLWAHKTSRAPQSNPYIAATPAGDVPRELLPDARIHDPNPPPGPGSPWVVTMKNGKPRVKRQRTPSEKQFDRERRDDWKYSSHRQYKEAVKAREAARAQEEAKIPTQAPIPRTRRASYGGTRAEQPPPLASAPRLSDSHAATSFSGTHSAQRKRSQSTSTPPYNSKQHVAVRVSLHGKTYYSYDGELYNYDPTVNAQVDTSIDPWPTRKKPTRSQTAPAIPAPEPLPPPPNSAPATTGYPGYHHGRYGSSKSSVPQQPKIMHSSTSPYPNPYPYTHSRSQTLAHASSSANPLPQQYPYPYTTSPLAPPNSAPAQGHGYGSAATFPRYVQGGMRAATPEAQFTYTNPNSNPNLNLNLNPPPKEQSQSKPLYKRVFFWSGKNGGGATSGSASTSGSTTTLTPPTIASPPRTPTKPKSPSKTKPSSLARPSTPTPTTPTTIRSLFGPPTRNKLTKHPHPPTGGSRMSYEGVMTREMGGTGSGGADMDEGWVRLSLDGAGAREREKREKEKEKEKEKNPVREGRDNKVRDWDEGSRAIDKDRSRPSDRHRSRHHERSYERDRERERDRTREGEGASKERERERRR